MKRFITFLAVAAVIAVANGQTPVAEQRLVTGNSDVIGLESWPSTTPLLIEAGPDGFYWLGGNSLSTLVDHPLLGLVLDDFANIYFIKYDKYGDRLCANHIRGTNELKGAFSFNGGLTLLGRATKDVETVDDSGDRLDLIPLNDASRIEFLAKFNDMCQYERMVPIWNMAGSQSPESIAQMDKQNGTIYVAGTSITPFTLDNGSIIGEGLDDYLYVLKYDRDLGFKDVFVAGTELNGEYGRYNKLAIIPDANGSVVITGIYEGDRAPIIAGETLKSMMMEGQGTFAFKLDREFEKVWIQQGNLNGYDGYDMSGIEKGLLMKNGDLIITGATVTGYFQLEDAEITFPGGEGFSNLFAYRMTPDRKVKWIRSLQNMAEAYPFKRKGTHGHPEQKEVQSEQFKEEIYWDAIQWNDEILYLAGSFLSDSFEVAGRVLKKNYNEGLFVVALELDLGNELWAYSMSGDFPCLHGFDLDRAGNVTLMGCTGEFQEFEVIGNVSHPGVYDLVFHLGLDFNGEPLWHNNAYLPEQGFGAYGSDLEVLGNGEIFSAMYKSTLDPLLIGESPLTSQYDYTSILAALTVNMELGGKVADEQSNPTHSGYVKAFKTTRSGAYPTVDSTLLDAAGGYLFNKLYPGTYILLALPDLKQFPSGMPTYAGGGISWNDAQPIQVRTDTKTSFLDITLSEVPLLTPEDGSGQMSGNVSYDDEVVAKGTKGEPATRTSVILVRKTTQQKSTSAEGIVAYVDTDDLGNYMFDNVPDGDYTLIVDVPGLPMIQTYEVNILANKIVSGLNFVVKKKGIETSGSVDVGNVQVDRFMIFPNPGNGLLNIEFTVSGDYIVRVNNMVGELVDSREYISVAGLVNMDISDLQSGMYLLQIEGEQGTESVKYMKE